ncbi:MAG: hypothetical protein K2X29_08810, partial [Candidatus Obscuribacterales bacterium]|nr:hypothetical protein [Candidatus Obscuribacterales bacterium]
QLLLTYLTLLHLLARVGAFAAFVGAVLHDFVVFEGVAGFGAFAACFFAKGAGFIHEAGASFHKGLAVFASNHAIFKRSYVLCFDMTTTFFLTVGNRVLALCCTCVALFHAGSMLSMIHGESLRWKKTGHQGKQCHSNKEHSIHKKSPFN